MGKRNTSVFDRNGRALNVLQSAKSMSMCQNLCMEVEVRIVYKHSHLYTPSVSGRSTIQMKLHKVYWQSPWKEAMCQAPLGAGRIVPRLKNIIQVQMGYDVSNLIV